MVNTITRCWIYKSLRKDEMYLYLRQEDDFEPVPAALMEGFGRYQFVMQLELHPDRPLARADVTRVIQNLRDAGYHLQMPPELTPDLYHGNAL